MPHAANENYSKYKENKKKKKFIHLLPLCVYWKYIMRLNKFFWNRVDKIIFINIILYVSSHLQSFDNKKISASPKWNFFHCSTKYLLNIIINSMINTQTVVINEQ